MGKRKTVTMGTLDSAFRKCMHEAYDYTCAYPNCPHCGNHSFRYSDVSIECAHWHNRWQAAGRWYPDNTACLCHDIHAYLENRRGEEAEFFYDHLGMERYDAVIERMKESYRYKPWERAEMTAYYRKAMRGIEAIRLSNSQLGLVRVEAWD